MNLLIIVDKLGSAIHVMNKPVEKYLDHLKVVIYPLHPKKQTSDQLYEAQQLMKWADVIDISYWKSGEVLKTNFPTEWEAKPKILFHHNPYDYDKSDWKDYKYIGCFNSDIQMKIAGSYLIPYGIDLDFYKYNDTYTQDKTVNMCVARIEGKKGVLEVAQACEELGYKFILVGRVSEDEYVKNVLNYKCVEFHENVTDEEKRDLYYKSAIHVCNSADNFESGTLPILEAMACGVPVLTRNIGQVPDISDGTNMVIRKGAKEDIEDLKKELHDLMENIPLREKMRSNGWETAKNHNEKQMVRHVNKLVYKAVGGFPRWVSVIVPTFDRPEALLKCLTGIAEQSYPNIEIIVVDSGNTKVEELVVKFRNECTKRPIKYIRFDNKGEYTLPKARNLGIQKALGEIIVFCDDRIKMDPLAVQTFERGAKHMYWTWGIKDNYEKGFVENFSCVMREDLIKYGMFNERITCYGATTQDIRKRFEGNGFGFQCLLEAKAETTQKTHKGPRRQDIINAKLIFKEFYD